MQPMTMLAEISFRMRGGYTKNGKAKTSPLRSDLRIEERKKEKRETGRDT